MPSLLGREFGARSFLYRVVVGMVILAITISVSVVWEKMVYTIPVLAVLLFLAAGMQGISGGTTTRNLDDDAGDVDADVDTDLDVDAGAGTYGG